MISKTLYSQGIQRFGLCAWHGIITVDANNQFETDILLPPGEHNVDIKATDTNNETTTSIYKVTVADGYRMGYDRAGNLVEQEMEDGKTRVYTWDAANRLLSIQSNKTPASGDWRSQFRYDGGSRRVGRTEQTFDGTNWVTGEDVTYLWCGTKICQKRNAQGSTVLIDFLTQGQVDRTSNNEKLFYTRDHLGSIREAMDQNGAVKVRYDYEPWGKRTRLSGNYDIEFGYTGHHHHEQSGLNLTWFRAYDSDLGRWLSADPLEDAEIFEHPNLYQYGYNNPINNYDDEGLAVQAAIGAATSVAAGYAIAKLTGDCYSGKEAAIDAATGALGVGVFNKLRKLHRLRKLKKIADNAGMKKVKSQKGTDKYKNGQGASLEVKHKGNPKGPKGRINHPGSWQPRAKLQVSPGTPNNVPKQFYDPFSGKLGDAKSWAGHIPLGATAAEAGAIGAAQGLLNESLRPNSCN